MEHPDVERALRTGYPRDTEFPRCPVCGNECDTVYRDIYGDVFACDECVTSKSAWEVEECFDHYL